MYIGNTTENVRELIEELEQKDDLTKLKFLIYIFDLLNNNQINNKNIVNPNLNQDDEDLVIFNFSTIRFPNKFIIYFLQFNIMLYNKLSKDNKLYEENGSIIGLNFDKEILECVKNFEKLSYNEKLDVFAELIIKYDNNSYFSELGIPLDFVFQRNSYEIARDIEKNKI